MSNIGPYHVQHIMELHLCSSHRFLKRLLISVVSLQRLIETFLFKLRIISVGD